MAKNPILQEINIANYASILLLVQFFYFFGGRWWHPAMSGKLRYGRKRTFTDMDGHLRTAGDSQLSAKLLFVLPPAHPSCKLFCMTSLPAGGVACRISTLFTDQTATTEQCDNLATRRAGVPPLDHVSVRRRAKFFYFLLSVISFPSATAAIGSEA